MVIHAGKAWIWVVVAMAILMALLLAILFCYLKIRRHRLAGNRMLLTSHDSLIEKFMLLAYETVLLAS